jgi:hypothetical protein
MSARPLGRNKPTDYSHVTAHPATEALGSIVTTPTPVVAGTDWMTGFDVPVLGADGKYRVSIKAGSEVRGGHCYCFEPVGELDLHRSWVFYDQGQEGSCEGHGNSRAMTLLHDNTLFDAFWLYDDARRIEGTYPSGEGSTNKAAAEALRRWGDHPGTAWAHTEGVIERVPWSKGVPSTGIKSFHWATSVEQIRQALGYASSVNEFPLLNSWGAADYPHRAFMSADDIATLLAEGAEYTILVPR